MRIVVTGASGNIGSQVLEQLSSRAECRVVGLARRPPESGPLYEAADWVSVDLADPSCGPQLRDVLRDADAVVHLAWLIQPSHDEATMRATNVDGSRHLLAAVRHVAQERGSAPAVVAASSVGAYAPGPKDQPVTESWPTDGIPSSIYSRHKVELERMLDLHEAWGRASGIAVRVVRIRPGVVFSARAASSQARYFLGPLIPMTLVRQELVPLLPVPPELAVPIVHAQDVAAAFVAATTNPEAAGAYNIAADEPLTGELIAEALHARRVSLPGGVLRAAADVSWRLHLQPTDPGWVDLALQLPVMSTERARRELGWQPRLSAADTLQDWLRGMRDRSGGPSPVLRASRGAWHQALAALPTVRSRGRRPV